MSSVTLDCDLQLLEELSNFTSELVTLSKHGLITLPEQTEQDLKTMIGKIVANRFDHAKEHSDIRREVAEHRQHIEVEELRLKAMQQQMEMEIARTNASTDWEKAVTLPLRNNIRSL